MHSPFDDFDYVLQHGRNIRIHPNGFIQIDVKDESGTPHRVHIWSPVLVNKPSVPSTGVHDHVYSFRSYIIKGRMQHNFFNLIPAEESPFDLYEAVKTEREDTVLQLVDKVYDVVWDGERSRMYGDRSTGLPVTYDIEAGEFHRVEVAGICVTVIRYLQRTSNSGARVVFRKGDTPLKKFSRYAVDAGELWEVAKHAYES